MNQVTDDNGVRDWSLLDRSAATLAKGSYFGQSMYGTFDFDVSYQPPDSQRQRQAPRRRAEAAIERKPTTVSQKSEADKGSAKVKYTFDVIKKVCNPFPLSLEFRTNDSMFLMLKFKYFPGL